MSPSSGGYSRTKLRTFLLQLFGPVTSQRGGPGVSFIQHCYKLPNFGAREYQAVHSTPKPLWGKINFKQRPDIYRVGTTPGVITTARVNTPITGQVKKLSMGSFPL